MNRLTVRLSIVGAVLTLGGATIAHSMLSQGDAPSTESDAGIQQVAQAPPAEPPTPIRAEESEEPAAPGALPPPSASAFTRPKSLQTVSHENTADPANEDAEPTPTADPIPTMSDGDAARSAYSAYASAAGDNPKPNEAGSAWAGAGGDSSAVSAGTSAPADPLAESTAAIVPEAPTYGSGLDKRDPRTPATSASWEPPTGGSTVPTSLSSTGFPVGNRVESASGSEGSVANSPPSAGQPYDVHENAAAPPPNSADLAAGSGSSEIVADTTSRGSGVSNEPRSGSTLSPGPDMTRTSSSALPAAVAGVAAGAAVAGANELPWGAPNRRASTPDTKTADQYPSSSAAGAVGSSPPIAPGGPGMYPSTADIAGRSLGNSAVTPSAVGPSSVDTPDLSSNVPGDRTLEGQQSPAIVIEKTAPDEVQVDRQATFQIRVRNVGTATAHNVVVVDQVPRGTEFVNAVPDCVRTPENILVWNVPSLKSNEEIILSINLVPKVAGEIGSVAQATFHTQASVRTVCTKPQLSLELTVPEKVLIGTAATIEIVVTNIGSGAATNVVMEEDVPEGFSHAAGRQLEHEIGTLRPQESRRLSLVLDAAKPGLYDNRLVVRGDGNLFEEDLRKIEVSTPKLEISMQGPALRYLDRQATYVVRLANAGTAPARNVELVTFLPKGMKYVTSDNHGQYDSQTHAVYWSLEELPAEKQGDVHLTVLPIEPGNHKLKADGRAELGLQHMCEHEVVVEGLAELSFSVTDAADPIEVGSETTYEVRVNNRGSKADSDVRVVAELPPGVTPTNGDGPVPATVQGRQVIFSPLARLAPNEEAVFKIHAIGEATGDHVIRVQLQSAELRVPVTKEEITRVYTDR